MLPELPRLIHQALQQPRAGADKQLLEALIAQQRKTQRWTTALVGLMTVFLLCLAAMFWVLKMT
jgi:ubiquinone biosynthesis protein